MLKKMMLMALSVGALIAFAAPAVAQANVELTDEGSALEPGAPVTFTSQNLTTTLPNGAQLKCEKVTFHFTLKTNGPEHVVLGKVGGGAGNNEGTTQGCTITIPGLGTLPATITDPTVDNEVTIDTWGTANINAHFTSDVPALGLGPCSLGGKVHVEATTTTDILHVNKSKLTGPGGGGCSTEGNIEGSFTAETPDETPIEIHSVETP